jgi:3-oxoadipate enol-lactonase
MIMEVNVMPKLKLKGVTLNYEVDDFTDPWSKNKSEAVLLHHGIGRNLNFWHGWVPVLSRKFKVVRIDARGFGKSSDPGSLYESSIEQLTEDVIALIDHLGISQIYFVGEGFASFVGYQLAISYPQRIKKLVVSAEAPYSRSPLKGKLESRLNLIDTGGLKAYVMESMKQRVGGTRNLGKWFAGETVKSSPHMVKSALRAVSNIDYRGRLSEIKSPVLGIFGEVSTREWDVDGKTIALMKQSLPKSSEFVVIKGAPIFVVYTKPDMCARMSLRFFQMKD